MTRRDPDIIYMTGGNVPYVRVTTVNFGGNMGITIRPLEGAKKFSPRELTFSPQGVAQLISIIERKRGLDGMGQRIKPQGLAALTDPNWEDDEAGRRYLEAVGVGEIDAEAFKRAQESPTMRRFADFADRVFARSRRRDETST